MRFQALSVEVLTFILGQLGLRDLLECRGVSRLLLRIIDASDHLQYRIDLAAASMVDGPPGRLTTTERRIVLRKYLRAWRELEFSSQPTLTIALGEDRGRPTTTGISGNVFLLAKPKSLELIQLPSRIKGTQQRRWTVDTSALGFDVSLFAMDPAQDLLVVVDDTQYEEAPIHLLSLTTGEAHSAAATAVIKAAESAQNGPAREIRIYCDVIGWLVLPDQDDEDRSSMELWNWKTGKRIWEMRFEGPDEYPLSFNFLDDSHVILTYYRRIAIYTFDSNRTDAASAEPSPTGYVVSLGLPAAIDDDDDAEIMSVILEPLESASPLPRRAPGAPFESTAGGQGHIVTMTIRSIEDRMARFLVFLPGYTLHRLVQRAGAEPDHAARTLAWDAWGPAGTRLVEVPYGRGEEWSAHCAQGTRAGIAAWTDYDARTLLVRVVDCGLPLLRRDMQAVQPAEGAGPALQARVAYVTAPYTVRAEDCFAEEITTRLPYCQSRWPLKLAPDSEDPSDVLLYEDGIVLLREHGNAEVYAL